MSAILITGGAGYIGSHTLRALQNANKNNLIVLDDLSTGLEEAIPKNTTFINGDIEDSALVNAICKEHQIQTIIHFAAKISVEESVEQPELYYFANTQKSARLIDSAIRNRVNNFIFSSTAAVYGDTGSTPVCENHTPQPTNPYGRSKLATEWYLEDRFKAAQMHEGYQPKWAALRYFNVAGAHMMGGLGQRNKNASHLIKMCCKVANGELNALSIFGDDYPTKDGTCIRDYIHVDDLAAAHVEILAALEQGATSGCYNVGYGKGYSVLEVIETFQKSNNLYFDIKRAPKRRGDSIEVVANCDKLRAITSWQPQYDDLSLICQSAWQWEKLLTSI